MVEELEKAGHQVVGLSRSSGVDLTTGEGLEAGLLGADVCVDVSMPVPAEGEDLVESLRKVSERIMAACEKAGVGHLVFLSITNLDNPHVAGFEYYQGKFAQEQVLEDSALPTSIVHSAQWMEFVLNPAAV